VQQSRFAILAHYFSNSVIGTSRARASFFTMRTEGFARTLLSTCEMYRC
jgi:hypothetical protein